MNRITLVWMVISSIIMTLFIGWFFHDALTTEEEQGIRTVIIFMKGGENGGK